MRKKDIPAMAKEYLISPIIRGVTHRRTYNLLTERVTPEAILQLYADDFLGGTNIYDCRIKTNGNVITIAAPAAGEERRNNRPEFTVKMVVAQEMIGLLCRQSTLWEHIIIERGI